MSLSYILYLNTPASPAALREFLVSEHGFAASESWQSSGGTPWLVSGRGAVLAEAPDPDDDGPYEYQQSKTLVATLDLNNQKGAEEFLLRVAGDILQRCPGDAALEPDTGGTILLRRDGMVWVTPDPYTREHLFSGIFRPARLAVDLPPPALSGAHQVGATT